VAELVDALDLGSSGVTRESSSLSIRTLWQKNNLVYWVGSYYNDPHFSENDGIFTITTALFS
jgi:hypothetical protein